MAAWPPSTHLDVEDQIEAAAGWAPSAELPLMQRLRQGEQLGRADGPIWTPGRFVSAQITGTSMTTVAVTADRLYLSRLYFAQPRTVDQIGINVSTAATGSLRMGLWSADPDTGLPTTVLLDSGTPQSSSTTGFKAWTINQVLHGPVWIGMTCSVAATFSAIGVNEMAPLTGAATGSNAPANLAYATHSQASAMPNLTGVALTWASATTPGMMLRAA